MAKKAYRLVPELVPETAWFRNLRSELGAEDWDVLRHAAYQKAGNLCEVCGGRGPRWPVECHERWEYDEAGGVQKLVGVIALCPACHEAKHVGLAQMNGRLDAVVAHMAKVNGVPVREAAAIVAKAFEEWERRSGREWRLDLSWLEEGALKLCADKGFAARLARVAGRAKARG